VNAVHGNAIEQLAGARVLVLNWRDVRHPLAGGAEQYIHQISRRWANAGVHVSWLTARPSGQLAREIIDGIHITRAGGDLTLYPRAARRLLRSRGDVDAIIDCQNGIPFFAPAFAGADVPIVQVVHHVHQDQFATRFSPPMAAVGRFLEGRVARAVYGSRAIAAVSPSTRVELRRRLGFTGPIFVVPNGTIDVPTLSGPRDPDPTLVVVTRLVQHKRVDLLLGEIAGVARQVPRLRVEIVGDGPERRRLQGLVVDLGLQRTVTMHGYLPDAARDALLQRAWLTTSTSAAEGWGCSIIEAAAWGVPCVALRVPGVRDSVVDGVTGWLVERPAEFRDVLVAALHELAEEDRAREIVAACQTWARCFSWDRSAELLAGVLLDEAGRTAHARTGARDRRRARHDIATVASFARHDTVDWSSRLRASDQVVVDDDRVTLLLNGCDDFDAAALLRRHGVYDATTRLATREDLLAGPDAAPHGRFGLDRTVVGPQ
jgi:glycosyltransferase involved in cell wall biosynthesis